MVNSDTWTTTQSQKSYRHLSASGSSPAESSQFLKPRLIGKKRNISAIARSKRHCAPEKGALPYNARDIRTKHHLPSPFSGGCCQPLWPRCSPWGWSEDQEALFSRPRRG